MSFRFALMFCHVTCDALHQAMEEEELEAINDKMQMQYDLGCFIKDELVPNAVKYYTGEAVEEDEEDYDDDEEVV